MTGSKMGDDGNEGGHDARQDAALRFSPHNNGILMATKTQVDKAISSAESDTRQVEDRQLTAVETDNPRISCSQDTQFHPDKGAVLASQECPDKPHVAPQPSSDGNVGEPGSIRSPGTNSITELCEIECTSEGTAGLSLYPKSPIGSAAFDERSFETKVDDQEGEGLKNGLTGAQLFADDGSKLGDGVREMQLPSNNQMEEDELSNGMNKKKLPPRSDSKEKDSKNGITELDLAVKNKPKEDALDNASIKIQLPTEGEIKEGLNNGLAEIKVPPENRAKEEELHNVAMERCMPSKNAQKVELLNNMVSGKELLNLELDQGHEVEVKAPSRSFFLEPDAFDGDETGTKMEQAAFMKDLEKFHKERCLDFKPPRFYGEPLNCLKLWRAVIRLGGYEQALLEYEKQKMRSGELPFTDASFTEHDNVGNQMGLNQPSGSGRARRDAAARAMQGWHSQRLLGNGEVGDPIIKDKNSISLLKREKQLKNIGLLKHKRPSVVERAVKVARIRASKPQLESMVVDIGPSAEWVKINVQKTRDCFEVYALVPGLLREEVRVQSDPAGRLVISGLPEHLDNPWGVTPFKKVVSLPSRIDPHQTSAVVTLHGQLFVRVPFEQSDA